ncbi:hypothetical protein [Pleionea sediminis]|uniref:hypothetical protein n=1 Tax=Pleionea sediminis TaxID=2569479 RepID=UPI001185876A|nr:hypothetical protein [Pleionea sediminis]
MTPLVILEKREKRKILRFEVSIQHEAMKNAKRALSEIENEVDAWALVCEGQIKSNGLYIDVITIAVKSKEMTNSLIFIQQF